MPYPSKYLSKNLLHTTFLLLTIFNTASAVPTPKGGGGGGHGGGHSSSSSSGSKSGSSSAGSHGSCTKDAHGNCRPLNGREIAGIVCGVIFGLVFIVLIALAMTNINWIKEKYRALRAGRAQKKGYIGHESQDGIDAKKEPDVDTKSVSDWETATDVSRDENSQHDLKRDASNSDQVQSQGWVKKMTGLWKK